MWILVMDVVWFGVLVRVCVGVDIAEDRDRCGRVYGRV